MAIRWKIPFVSLTEDQLTINIYDNSFSGTAVVLTGAATPFVTKDDADDNILTPSRASTGSIIVYNDGRLDEIIPTSYKSRKVTLTKGSSILWQGYIQPQQFGRDMYIEGEDVSYPVVDMLAVLANIDMDWHNHQMRMETFGELIKEAIEASGATIDTVLFPKEWHNGSDYLAWAKLSVNRYNWFQPNDITNTQDTDAEKYDSISYRQLLELIAQQLGWIVSIQGTTLLFVSPVKSEYLSVSFGSLTSLSATISEVSSSSWSVTSRVSVSIDNEQTSLQGAKSVKIEAMANAMSELELGISTKGLKYVRERKGKASGLGKTLQALVFSSQQQDMTLFSYQLQGGQSSDATEYEIGYDATSDNTGTPHVTTQIAKVDIYSDEDVKNGNKINYSYAEAVLIDFEIPEYLSQAETGTYEYCSFSVPIVRFSGAQMPPQKEGCLDFSFDCAAYNDLSALHKAFVQLKVGNKYFSALDNCWKTAPTRFTVNMEAGSVKPTKTLSMPYESASHFVIPINELIGGEVELTIYATDEFLVPAVVGGGKNTGTGVMVIKNLSLKYCQPDTLTYIESEAVATYAARSSGFGQNTEEVTLKMATKTTNLKNGYALLYFGNDFAQASSPQYRSTAYTAETALLDKMKRSYFRVTSQIKPVIEAAADSAPSVGEIGTWQGKSYMVISRDRDWRDSKVKLIMQETI